MTGRHDPGDVLAGIVIALVGMALAVVVYQLLPALYSVSIWLTAEGVRQARAQNPRLVEGQIILLAGASWALIGLLLGLLIDGDLLLWFLLGGGTWGLCVGREAVQSLQAEAAWIEPEQGPAAWLALPAPQEAAQTENTLDQLEAMFLQEQVEEEAADAFPQLVRERVVRR